MSKKYYLKIDKDRCKECNLCVEFCPLKHLQLSKDINQKGKRYVFERKDNDCIGCGICFYICPDNCIEIYEEE